jgi:hypothetical protein
VLPHRTGAALPRSQRERVPLNPPDRALVSRGLGQGDRGWRAQHGPEARGRLASAGGVPTGVQAAGFGIALESKRCFHRKPRTTRRPARASKASARTCAVGDVGRGVDPRMRAAPQASREQTQSRPIFCASTTRPERHISAKRRREHRGGRSLEEKASRSRPAARRTAIRSANASSRPATTSGGITAASSDRLFLVLRERVGMRSAQVETTRSPRRYFAAVRGSTPASTAMRRTSAGVSVVSARSARG